MKKIFYLLIAFSISANLMAEIQISGVVKSHNGTPLQYANVVVFDAENPIDPIAIFTADKNGNYKITITDSLLQIRIDYAAPNHNVLKVPVVVLPNKNYAIDVNLAPLYFEKISDEIWVIGDFNNFSQTENAIKMTKLTSGIYIAKIPNIRDTVGYQILFNVRDTMGWQNSDTGVQYFIEYTPRTINGQRADFYKPVEHFGQHNRTNYISYIISNEKEIQIEFDPTKITAQLPITTLSSADFTVEKIQHYKDTMQPIATIKSDNPAIEKIFQYNDIIKKIDAERRNNMNVSDLTEAEKNIYRYLTTDSISAWFANTNAKELKTFLAINYIDNFWGDANDAKLDKNIINFLSENYPLNYFFLSGGFLRLCALESDLANEDLLSNKRLQKFLENIDKKSGGYVYILERMIVHYMDREDTATAMVFYDILKSDFPNHPSTFAIERWFNISAGNRKIVVGNMIPDFELPNVDKPDEMISMQKLRGKWVLIDVWHRYCGPCLAEIPNMKVVYEKYKSKNFEIYGISTDSPDVLKNFKAIPRYEMPWLHSSARGTDVVKLLETVGVPHYILVAPDGKIVATGFTLRGNNLNKTLAEFLP